MRTLFFLFLLLFLAPCLFSHAAIFDNCRDDQRLSQLSSILADNYQGNIIDEPLEMTPATFIRLHPAARKALGNNILVCGLPLNSKGLPAVKLEMDFYDIFDALQFAIGMEDWENVEFIRDSVKVKKLPLDGIWSLLGRTTWGEKSQRQLANILGIIPKDHGQDFYVLDIYTALGGFAENPERVLSVSDIPPKKAWAESKKISISFKPPISEWNNDERDVYKSLSRAGIRFGNYYEMENICR